MKNIIVFLPVFILFVIFSSCFAGPFDRPKGQQYNAHTLAQEKNSTTKNEGKPCGCRRKKSR